jgi:hypothetical protein
LLDSSGLVGGSLIFSGLDSLESKFIGNNFEFLNILFLLAGLVPSSDQRGVRVFLFEFCLPEGILVGRTET